jgi:hypothetical protein
MTAMAFFYVESRSKNPVEECAAVCRTVGFEPDDVSTLDMPSADEHSHDIAIPHDGLLITLHFNLNEDRAPDIPLLLISHLNEVIYPEKVRDDETHQHRMNVFFELVCRLSTTLDVEYVAVSDNAGFGKVLPETRPIADAVERFPILGVYAASVVDQFGGLETMIARLGRDTHESQPWYTATIPGGQTLVIELEMVWDEGNWRPPTEAPYLVDAEFHS